MALPNRRDAKPHVLAGPVGGVNTRTYPTEIPDGDFVFLKNLELAESLGAFATRKGTKTYNTTLLGSPIRGGIRWYHGSGPTQELLVISGTDIYKGTDAGGTFASILAGVTADRDWFFAASLDNLYIANGVDTIKRRNGPAATIRAAGFAAPGTTATVAVGAAGVLTGSYQYKVTFVYDSTSANESSASAATATVAPSAQRVELTAIPTGGTGATARNIYRTKANQLTKWFFLATISDNSTTVYSDNLADSTLGTDQAPTDNGIPPAGQFIINWRGRMVIAKTAAQPQRVFLSSITNTEKSPNGTVSLHGSGVEIFPATHYVDVGDDNSPVTGLAVVNDQLVIFKEDKIYNMTGESAGDIRVWMAQAAVGCVAPKTIVNMLGLVYFLGRSGGVPEVYSYNGMKAESVSLPIEPTLKANMKDLGNVASQSIQPCAGRYRFQYILSYAKVGGSTFECAIFDTREPQPRWSFVDKIEASVFIPFNGPGDKGEMYYGHQSEGRVLRLDIEDTDYHATTPTAISALIETGWMHLGAPNQFKQIKWIELYGRKRPLENPCGPDPGTPTVTVERRYDFNTTGTNQDANAVTVAPVMTPGGTTVHTIWKLRITCIGSEGTDADNTLFEQGYIMKMLITLSGPIEVYKVVVYFTAEPPGTTHDLE